MNTPKYIIAFLFLFATTIFAQETPPAEVIPGAAGGMEILGKRTLKSKTFYNPNTGEITVEMTGGYLHFRDENGRLRPNAESWSASFELHDGAAFRGCAYVFSGGLQ